jgi:hypothetical protein
MADSVLVGDRLSLVLPAHGIRRISYLTLQVTYLAGRRLDRKGRVEVTGPG